MTDYEQRGEDKAMAVWIEQRLGNRWLSFTSDDCAVVLKAIEQARRIAAEPGAVLVPPRAEGADWESVEALEYVSAKVRALRTELQTQERDGLSTERTEEE